MKILVCTDGSKQSQKAIKMASTIAKGCRVNEVAFLHVYSKGEALPISSEGFTGQQMESFQKMLEELKKEKEKILSDAVNNFNAKNIKTRNILREGQPSDTIIKVAREEEFDLIVLGSRGLGGLNKILLGSVSNTVVQEAKDCSVLVVK